MTGASQIGTIDSMRTQIAVRLPDELVAWIDEQVAQGGGSRAAVATRALRRYQRQVLAEKDAEIYRSTEPVAWSEPNADGRAYPILD